MLTLFFCFFLYSLYPLHLQDEQNEEFCNSDNLHACTFGYAGVVRLHVDFSTLDLTTIKSLALS